ncbi:MAG: hypothetical protein ACXWKN_12375 [Phenylobacterium sp.]
MERPTPEARRAQLVAMLDDIDQRLMAQYKPGRPQTAARLNRIARYEGARSALLRLIELHNAPKARA